MSSALHLPPGGGFWNGVWQTTGELTAIRNQQDDSIIGTVVAASARDVDAAVREVAAAARARTWAVWQRREALAAASLLLAQRGDAMARLLSAESSKTIRAARAEVARAVETLRLSSEQARTLVGETIPFDDTPRGVGRRGWYTREPVGVVAAITPFNDPLNLVAHKVGPALMGGNAVVLKPSEKTPLTALALLEILLEAGVPADLVAVMHGTGAEVGQTLVEHPQIALVSFTGGYATGRAISQHAGPKRLLMELGGNGAVIVMEDARLEPAATAIVAGAFGNTGQNCLSVQRVFVHRSRVAELVSLVTARTESLLVGRKESERTDVGPMIDEANALRVEEEAVAGGARVATGGRREGVFYRPTVLTEVPPQARVWREEVFGPVVSIVAFDEVDQAIVGANDSEYGLQAGVFAADLELALAVADRLEVGAVMINDTGDFRVDAMPFGGGKRSGIGREGVRYAIESMTEPKIVALARRDH